MTASDPVDRFAQAIEQATIPSFNGFAPDVKIDATVANWRMAMRGREAALDGFRHWYAEPGAFEDVRRSPLPHGELLEFTLTWEEQGVPHTCHQAHVLEVREGQIVADRVWCGGRWPASLLAEMAAAQ